VVLGFDRAEQAEKQLPMNRSEPFNFMRYGAIVKSGSDEACLNILPFNADHRSVERRENE
jgi:hypothetical protein